jgi:Leucine-rich repeat (LRR) protein
MTQISHSNTTVSYKELADQISQSGVTSLTLKDVTVTGNDMDEMRFTKSLRAHETLEQVSLTNVTVTDPEAPLDAAISMLLVTTSVKVLCLDNTKVSTAGAIASAGYCTSLESLLLPNNGLEDSDAAQIAEAVARNGNIQTLDLTGNNMTDIGCAAFGKALIKNVALRVLKLDGNSGISGGSLSEISATLSKRSATAA